MSGFAGFCDYSDSLTEEKYLWMALARRMARRIGHRGPGDQGAWVTPHCAMAQVLLAPSNHTRGEPITMLYQGQPLAIVFDGFLRNREALFQALLQAGFPPETQEDSALALGAYLAWGENCGQELQGSFAFVIDDKGKNRTFFCRDPLGAKPLFFVQKGDQLAFASEMKGLFEFPGMNPEIKGEGICQLFTCGGVRLPGETIFAGVEELLPGHWALCTDAGMTQHPYFSWSASPHTLDYQSTVSRVCELMTQGTKGLLSNSGGFALLSHSLADDLPLLLAGIQETPPFPALTLGSCPSSREDFPYPFSACIPVTATQEKRADALFEGVIARDLPGLGDLECLLLPALHQGKKEGTIALWGMGTALLFGELGHWPDWTIPKETVDPDPTREGEFPQLLFPWENPYLLPLLRPELRREVGATSYQAARFWKNVHQVPLLRGESSGQRKARTLFHLTAHGYLPHLLEMGDRCASAGSMELILPFAQTQLLQLLGNMPPEYQSPGGIPGGLLLDCARSVLPKELRNHYKGPMGKQEESQYAQSLRQRLAYILQDSLQPIHFLLHREQAQRLLEGTPPWRHQITQAMAYLITLNYWLLHYQVYIHC